MRDVLLRIWVVFCVAVVLVGAAWWLRDGWPGADGTAASEGEVVLLADNTGLTADDSAVRLDVGILATAPEVIRDRPDLARLDIGQAVGSTSSTALRTSDGQAELRGTLLVGLRATYPDAGIERVLITDLVMGSP